MTRAAFLALVLAVCLFTGMTGDAQQAPTFFVSGRNVNTVGAAPAPGVPNPTLIGNPYFKQRNEASCDVSPDDPFKVLCANNDYRGVEVFGRIHGVVVLVYVAVAVWAGWRLRWSGRARAPSWAAS